MKMEAFRVQNYKKVKDTGWVTCRDLTVFVGKNEAGKSAVFRGLSKLNPSDGERYDGLKEFPRRRYTDEFAKQDWPVASARFALDAAEQTELAEVCPFLNGISTVTCARPYSWAINTEFNDGPKVKEATVAEFVAALDTAIALAREMTAPEGKGEALKPVKEAIINLLTSQRTQYEQRPPEQAINRGDVDGVLNAIVSHGNEAWQKALSDPVANVFKLLAERYAMLEKLAQARKWVEEHIPQFIYFDRYDVIESAIHVPTFVGQVSQNPPPPRARTTHCLFKHVGLDVAKLRDLGRHAPNQGPDSNVRRQIDERAILASSASNAMTAKFSDWWEQRKHEFRYQVDGDYFRIWVSDDLDPSEIELDQRSAGMQYFFSFFTVFLVESQGTHRNSILLLDEPGLHLHGTAQAKVVKFLVLL